MTGICCVREVMGMPITVEVRDVAPNPEAVEVVYKDLALVDRTFSPFLAQSEVSRINRGELRLEDSSDSMRQILDLCRLYERVTDGYFTAWFDGRFDPTGLVKGWAIDRACAILDRFGFRSYLVDAGGDVRVRGHNGVGAPWQIGIRHPVERDKVTRVVLAGDLAVATSGTYEKGEHIIDPHSGRPATELLSLTVIGTDIMEADIFATAAFAMGARGLQFIENLAGFEGYAISPDLRATLTSGFAAHCAPSPSCEEAPLSPR
jgi:thiamine biosynthesis lipoprotein